MLSAFLLFLLLPAVLVAQDVPIPPAPTQWVTDTAGFLSASDVERLNAKLRSYEEQTQHQLLVYIGTTTGQVPIEDWANRAFEKWKIGRKGIDDGLALFIMAKDRRLRIEVGYGLEPKVPDLLANRIIQETIVPRIRAGDNAGAIEAGMQAVTQAIGQPLPGEALQPQTARGRPTAGQLGLLGIMGIVVVLVLMASPAFAIWVLMSLFSGRNRRGPRGGRRGGGGFWGGGYGGGFGGGGWTGGGGGFGGGGWGGGGGGFSGGGGMSGGGGASGSW
jgi:uncharacterized protein